MLSEPNEVGQQVANLFRTKVNALNVNPPPLVGMRVFTFAGVVGRM